MEEIRNKKKIWGRLLLSMLLAAGLISGCGNSAGTELPTEQTADGSGLEVHFIDVGQADAALVLCDGESMLIDGGNSEDSDVIYTYLEKQKVEELDYMVCTHAHEDACGRPLRSPYVCVCGYGPCPGDGVRQQGLQKFSGGTGKAGDRDHHTRGRRQLFLRKRPGEDPGAGPGDG